MSGKVISRGLFLVAFVLYLPLTGCAVIEDQELTSPVMEMSDLAAIEETVNPENEPEEDIIGNPKNETALGGRNNDLEGGAGSGNKQSFGKTGKWNGR